MFENKNRSKVGYIVNYHGGNRSSSLRENHKLSIILCLLVLLFLYFSLQYIQYVLGFVYISREASDDIIMSYKLDTKMINEK